MHHLACLIKTYQKLIFFNLIPKPKSNNSLLLTEDKKALKKSTKFKNKVRFCLDEEETSSNGTNKDNIEDANQIKFAEPKQSEIVILETQSKEEKVEDSNYDKFDLIKNTLEDKKSLINTLIAAKGNLKSKLPDSKATTANDILDEYYSIQDEDCKTTKHADISILRVFLENQTIKSFRYDKNTCVRDVLNCLKDKLNIKFIEYFGLVVKLNIENYVSKFIPLDETRPLYRICDVFSDVEENLNDSNYQCMFRFMFIPSNYNFLIQNDENSFNYLYEQVRNNLLYK